MSQYQSHQLGVARQGVAVREVGDVRELRTLAAEQQTREATGFQGERNRLEGKIASTGECCRELEQVLNELYAKLKKSGYLTFDPAEAPAAPEAVAQTEPAPASGIAAELRNLRTSVAQHNGRLIDITGFVNRLSNAVDS